MKIARIDGYIIRGICCSVPARRIKVEDFAGEHTEKIIGLTGIREKRHVERGVSFSDVGSPAVSRALDVCGWSPASVGCLVVVTQTSDYHIPAVSHIIQEKVGIPCESLVLDIRSGCSGFIYGLFAICSMMSVAGIERGVLVCGDLPTLGCNPHDLSTYALFGDAVCAILIEKNEQSKPMYFSFGSDGGGYDAIIIPEGGSASPLTPDSLVEKTTAEGYRRRGIDIHLNGLKIYNFAVGRVVPHIREFMRETGTSPDTIDYFVFHQASSIINEGMRRLLAIPKEKYLTSLERFGNTSSASIPLTIATSPQLKNINGSVIVLGCGFGVGLSWGNCLFTLDERTSIMPLIEI